jgi:late competence protein required for DNA uptake (superfamily II DNA/RNA helicase)
MEKCKGEIIMQKERIYCPHCNKSIEIVAGSILNVYCMECYNKDPVNCKQMTKQIPAVPIPAVSPVVESPVLNSQPAPAQNTIDPNTKVG